jgi:membrane fusion protein (multidrug efflux system)
MSAMTLGRQGIAAPARQRAPVSTTRLAIAGLAFAAIAGGVWYGHDWWTTGRFIESTDDAYVGGNVTTISPHVAGFVVAILVGDNEQVSAGQLLVQIDRRDVDAAHDRAQAVVDARVAALASLRAQYALQQSTIQQSLADRAAKTARAAFTRSDDARYTTLAVGDVGSRQNAERAQAAASEASAALAGAEAGLTASQQQLKSLDAQIAEAEAAIVQAQAELARATLDLDYTQIRSPIDGYVGNRAAQIGAYVAEGSYLLSVIPDKGLWVDANFKEDQLARMRAGEAASIVTDVAPGKVLRGHLLSLAPGTGAVFSVIPPENATGNFTKIVQRVPVRIALDPTDTDLSVLRPGLSAYASVDTRAAP